MSSRRSTAVSPIPGPAAVVVPISAMQRLLLASLAAFSLVSLSACGHPWRVVRASGPPSALVGQTSIGVSFDWSRASLGGRSEAEWLATQPAEDQASYNEVRERLMGIFVDALSRELGGVTVQPSTGQEAVQLVVQPLVLEMGFYRFVMAMDSQLDSALVWGVGGQVTDEITVRTRVTANLTNPAIIGRMNDCATRTARLAAAFFRDAQRR